MAATAATVAFRVHSVTTGPVADLAREGTTITAELELTDDPRVRKPKSGSFHQESVIVEATLTTLETQHARTMVQAPVVVFASGPAWRPLLPSQRVSVSGKLAPSDAGTLTAAVFLARGAPKILTAPSTAQTAAGAIRSGLRTAADALPPDQRGLLPGLVVGDTSRMDPHVTADLKAVGLTHLNAVSGANLAIVAGAALALSRLAGLTLPLRALLAAAAMIAFAVVARPSPSVLRALTMGLIAAIALGTGRPKNGMAALSAAVLLLILFDPELARSYGFALSVAATAGILLLAPRWRDRLTTPHLRDHPSVPHLRDHPSPPHRRDHLGTTRWRDRLSTIRARDLLSAPRWWDHPSLPRHEAAAVTSLSPARGALRIAVREVLNRCLPSRTTGSTHHKAPARGSLLNTNAATASEDEEQAVRSRGPRIEADVGFPQRPRTNEHAAPSGSGPGRADSRWFPRRMPRWAAEALAVPAAAQAAVTPVLVLMSGQITPVAVIANLLAGPAVAPATLLGFAAALVAPFSPELASLMVLPAGYAVGWIITVARWSSGLPFGAIPWPGGVPGLALLVVVVAVAVPLLRRIRWRMTLAVGVLLVLIAAVTVTSVLTPWPPRRWLMVMCDVGQGDGLVIAAGDSRAVVVDTGPDPVLMDECLRDLGIREIPLLVLTHPHADHIGGLSGALRGRTVGAIVTSPTQAAEPRASTSASGGSPPAPCGTSARAGVFVNGGGGETWAMSMVGHAARGGGAARGDALSIPAGAGLGPAFPGRSLGDGGAPGTTRLDEEPGRTVPRWVPAPGTTWRFGPSEVTVLGPDASLESDGGATEGSRLNNGSLVLRVRWQAGSILLSGDVEPEAQSVLLRTAALRADILKVPHHGSGRQDAEFLAAVGARAALISVGADNDYGHPAPSALGVLHRLGARVYRTDQSGDIAVVDTGEGLGITTRR
ncbi:ComEC/Rec2 family competence protein [Nonomuraea sp. NBC_01738]|uniref:ComEC/Rec2 family competence protein n=1 Tax=Nonomuraea sp. NBC_01738 TaxID=2976003 RepID=UPI002E0E2D23|nr:ComEC/Rec2 family competence protein [Nonomuraea sp. NBC_01738]